VVFSRLSLYIRRFKILNEEDVITKTTFQTAVFSLLAVVFVGASATQAQHNPDTPRKQMTALKVNSPSPHLDGRLDDPVWQKASWVSDFLQKEPAENGVPTVKTEVAIVWDDDAVFVGARMYCEHPESLAMYLDRHDNQGPAEQFIVSFDSYHDHRTAYGFGVNVAGVRFDRYNRSDNEGDRDFSYNPVWEAKTARDSVSWTCEMRIPFSQLRYSDIPEQRWGVQFNRWIPSRFEDIFWVVVPKNATGFSSWFGEMTGIRDVKPSRRLELMPYAASNAGIAGVAPPPGDPLHDRVSLDKRIGGDLKMGLGPNLTLDATINPDFGQVEADPAVVNLSAYETSFSERRPFFSEGNDLLHPEGPSYFYSRRIGGAPRGPASGDFVKYPENATILGAAKISGKISAKTSVSVLGAVTGREKATVYDSASNMESKVVVEPTTTYGLTGLRREFGASGSTVGLLLTGLSRDFSANSDLKKLLRSQAYTGNLDWNLRFKGGMYDIVGYAGFSHVRGDASVITRTQQAPAHYFQRPDEQNRLSVDSTRTAMTGFTAELRGGKRSGKHWLWGGGGSIESPDFELNDVGLLGSADDIGQWGHVTYRETKPGKLFHSYSMQVDWYGEWNGAGTNTYKEIDLSGSFTFTNFSSLKILYAKVPSAYSDDLTRGGPLMKGLATQGANISISSPYGRSTQYNGSFSYNWGERNQWLYSVRVSYSRRIGSRLAISVLPSWNEYRDPLAWIGTDSTGGAATYGDRYIFAALRASELRIGTRVNYYFSPVLSLEVYVEPFAAAGNYFDHGELAAVGTNEIRKYGTDGTTITRDAAGYHITDGSSSFDLPDRNFGDRSFQSNMVLRWEFARGSAMYLVWQRNRSDAREPGRQVRFRSLGDAFAADGSDYLAFKISYWIPVR
jgi:hypothetical protein